LDFSHLLKTDFINMDSHRYSTPTISFGGPMTRAVKGLIVANVAVFVLRFWVHSFSRVPFDFDEMFGLVPAAVTQEYFLWQLVSYLFVHAGIFHVLFNMLMLWMFGCDLERRWGSSRFLRYYFLTGIGAGFCVYVVSPLSGTSTVGASGAIFGLLLAYGVLFADRIIYLYFLFPVRAKYFVMIMGAIEFYAAWTSSGSGISNTAHLGGMMVGYLFLRGGGLPGRGREIWDRWRIQRARRKFQVYMSGLEASEEERRRDRENKKPMIQ
jgi:membrane associated rhomboid family serine protease